MPILKTDLGIDFFPYKDDYFPSKDPHASLTANLSYEEANENVQRARF